MEHDFPFLGKYWTKNWEFFVMKKKQKLLFWENVGKS